MLKRLFELTFAFISIILLIPIFIIISVLIVADSKGGIFYKQMRVGKNGKGFYLYKFRSMQKNADKNGLLITGRYDSRITKVGHFIRKYKIDELPQLMNVLLGDMNLVGPRPEVSKYVDLYNEEQKKVLLVKPGITDYASIEYSNENVLLSTAMNPEQTYINYIMPAKLKLNLKYIEEQSLIIDLKIIWNTILKIIK